jgi:hypothetical protein
MHVMGHSISRRRPRRASPSAAPLLSPASASAAASPRVLTASLPTATTYTRHRPQRRRERDRVRVHRAPAWLRMVQSWFGSGPKWSGFARNPSKPRASWVRSLAAPPRSDGLKPPKQLPLKTMSLIGRLSIIGESREKRGCPPTLRVGHFPTRPGARRRGAPHLSQPCDPQAKQSPSPAPPPLSPGRSNTEWRPILSHAAGSINDPSLQPADLPWNHNVQSPHRRRWRRRSRPAARFEAPLRRFTSNAISVTVVVPVCRVPPRPVVSLPASRRTASWPDAGRGRDRRPRSRPPRPTRPAGCAKGQRERRNRLWQSLC